MPEPNQPTYDPTANRYQRPEADAPPTALLYAVSGAIAISTGVHAITKAGVAVMTLAPPTAAQAGTRLLIVARTAFAHTVTITEGLGGNAADDVMTFAKVGDSIHLLADNLHWVPVGAPYGVVIS